MRIESIETAKNQIIEQYGEWTAHNIQLDGNTFTISNKVVGQETKLRRLIQIISDATDKPLADLRVLDLACLEGLYAVELAKRGAQVIGIEGREINIEKARFAQRVLSLDNLEFIQDDVRNLNKEKYGQFDVVLCCGILYHLNVPDVFEFVNNIAEVCQGIAIFDTHITIAPNEFHVYKDKEYWGWAYTEYNHQPTNEEQEKAAWASINNIKSFWFSRPSLYNLLADVGFTSVYECCNPPLLETRDRITLLAVKNILEKVVSSPPVNELPHERWPEKSIEALHPAQQQYLEKCFATAGNSSQESPNKGYASKILRKIIRNKS